MSDIQLYDTAVRDYLLAIHPRTYYSLTDKAKLKCAKHNNDSTKYPFITYFRDNELTIDENRMNSSVVSGHKTRMYKNNTTDPAYKTEYVHSIPVNLLYQVDVWSSSHSALLELSQALLIDLKSARPILEVPINPDGELGRFHILDVSLVDNSDIEEEEEKGKTYRHTFSFTLEAYIKRVRVEDRSRFNNNYIEGIYD